MARHLFLLRHADTSKDPGVNHDRDRPLTDQGQADAMRVGRWMRQQSMRPQAILSSPAVRAGQTARLVCEELGLPEDRIEWEDTIYEASPADLVRLLDARSEVESILLVGHNPAMEGLLEALCGVVPHGPDGKVLTPGSLARVRAPDDEIVGQCRMEGITRPADIPA